MATESVKILIEAEDKASAQIVAATKKIDGAVKSTKEMTKNAKSSTEIFGSLAGALGGSEIGSFASQIGGLTGKLGEFAEVSKLGGAGALAFKAGLVGVVGVMSFQVGNALGNMIFETDKWNKELEKSIELSKKMAAELNRLADVRLGDALADIQFLENPEKQIEQIRELSNKAGEKVSSLAARIEALKREQTASSFDKDANIFGSFLGEGVRTAEIIREIESLTEAKEKENARALALDKQAGDATRQIEKDKLSAIRADEKYLESLDKQLAMLQAVIADETGLLAIREQAAQATSGLLETDSAKQAEDKLKEIKALQEQIDLEKVQREEKKKALEDEFNQVKRIEDLYKAESQRLEEQKVLLEQGAEAAAAFRLEKQGLSAEDAKSFAKQQTELDTQKQVQDKMKQRETAAPLQAFSSRFLTRGPTDNKMLDVAKTQLKVQQEQLAELKKQKPEGPKMRDIRIVEVG